MLALNFAPRVPHATHVRRRTPCNLTHNNPLLRPSSSSTSPQQSSYKRHLRICRDGKMYVPSDRYAGTGSKAHTACTHTLAVCHERPNSRRSVRTAVISRVSCRAAATPRRPTHPPTLSPTLSPANPSRDRPPAAATPTTPTAMLTHNSFGGLSPERKAAQALETLLTFTAAK